jgi:hypothetical protein
LQPTSKIKQNKPMMMKELSYPCSRLLSPYLGEPERVMDGRLTLTFYLRPAAGHTGDLLARYNALSQALDSYARATFQNRLLIGLTQLAPKGTKSFVRLQSEADAANLGNFLLRQVCPPLIAPQGFNLERLNVAFGVFEKASCYPRRDAVAEYAYTQPHLPTHEDF